ncbi:MAG TPA: hypothetical protein VJ890_14955 [Vineibacter sp.]|nr:hypothetical protein [Vineibacter sp.]
MPSHDIDPELVRRITADLTRLYRGRRDDHSRYVATLHVLRHAMAAMVARGAADVEAVQMLVTALIQILSEGLGAAGAADHLRSMASQLDELARR